LVAVADEMPGRAQALAAKCGAHAYAGAGEMLERETLDVVDVCTPSGKHGTHAIEVMRSGRHVIVEKPMEIRLAAIEEMLRVQDEMGVTLAVISQHRFDPAARTVRRLIDEGALGRLVLGMAHIPWWRSQEYYDSGAWRGTWELDGGGVLMNQSIHSIDLLQWFMGRVRSVVAYTDTLAHRMDTEDVAAVALRFESGALGTISATTGAYPGIITRVEIFGDEGSASIENDQLAVLRLKRDDPEEVSAYGGGGERVSPAPGAAQDPSAVPTATHAEQIADMIRAIRAGGTPLVDGQAARHPVEIILAIYESARTGREVRLS
jgi:UDP-N-acetyl-2-amino-2-deoxyglucuronate dehydrogenase